MKHAFRSGAVITALIALFAIFGSGTSWAKDPYVGKTYAEAAAKLAEKGFSPVVATSVGDQLSTDDCIVTSSRKATYVRKDNFDHDKNWLLSLNCSAPLAHGGSPGNSLASPQGRKEKGIEEKAAKFNDKPERCAQNLQSCKQFCDKYAGMCSKEVLSLL